MSAAQIERIRRLAQTDNVWSRHWGEQARKTVVRRIIKRLPVSSPELERVFEFDEQASPVVLDQGPSPSDILLEQARAEEPAPVVSENGVELTGEEGARRIVAAAKNAGVNERELSDLAAELAGTADLARFPLELEARLIARVQQRGALSKK